MTHKKEVTCKRVLVGGKYYTVHVCAGVRGGKRCLYTKAYDDGGVEIPAVRTQKQNTLPENDREKCRQLINRVTEKLAALVEAERKDYNYRQAYCMLSETEKRRLCPDTWNAQSTIQTGLQFYEREMTLIYDDMLHENYLDDAVLEQGRERVLSVVRRNQGGRYDEGNDALEKREMSAIKTANQHIFDANRIYEASRSALAHLDLPPIRIPQFDVNRAIVSAEQCKAISRDKLVQMGHIFFRDVEKTSLAVGAIIMMCCMTRTAEVCPKYKEILHCGDYGVYAILTQSNGECRVGRTKTKNSNRIIILPKFAMDAMEKRRNYLLSQKYSEAEIEDSYVVSADADIHHVMNPKKLSAYIKDVMNRVGFDATYWNTVTEVMGQEPDTDTYGNVLTDITAYVLRRSGCTYLMNCAACPQVDGMSCATPFGLVDTLMGHALRPEDREWKNWIKRDDNWPLVAQMMESIVIDPNHSAHPAFKTPEARESAMRVGHQVQAIRVTEDGDLTITCRHGMDNAILIRLPKDCTVERIGKPVPLFTHDMPIVQEELDRAFYEKNIRMADDIYNRERG